MYKVIWDIETKGILLTDKADEKTELVPPRPVFWQELDFFGFNKYWNYEKVKEPLLWAIDRRYFYKGQMVAEARGGNIFECPKITITEVGQNLNLIPVNVPLMTKKNKKAIFVVENEAMDFVSDVYKKYKKKVDYFVVAFSGGKDSQVILDIVSRVIPPDDYLVMFTDTDMEIPPTYEAVEAAKKYYQEKYPGLRFETAKSDRPALELWEIFGPPSMMLRWCCSVSKSVPFQIKIKELSNSEKQPKILVFDGIRAEESLRRENYKRLAKSVKHPNQINAEVIKEWNTSEVFLYLFYRNIDLNIGYRLGLNRIGCNICPFGTILYEYIINKLFPNITGKYIKILQNHIELLGIKEKSKIKEYLEQGQWKKRGGGAGVDTQNTRIDFESDTPDLQVVLTNPKENFMEWVKVIGDLVYKEENNKITGEIEAYSDVFKFEMLESENNKIIITIFDTYKNSVFLNKIKKVLYKTVYCVHCRSCEVECSYGALKTLPYVNVNPKCVHCGNCLNFENRGCIMAKSIAMPEGNKKMSNKMEGFGRYLRFGVKKEWLISFLNEKNNWFTNNNLGNKQVESMLSWLRDAELLEIKGENKTITELANILSGIYLNNEILVWEIIWINFYYNSNLVKWYIENINYGENYTSNELIQLVLQKDENIRESTVSSGINSLVSLLENSLLGNEMKLGVIEKKGNIRRINKIGRDEPDIVSIAYLLYKNARQKSRYEWTVSDFYGKGEIGPHELFGILKEKFENSLRVLQENKNEIVKVDIGGGLDNIHLREDLNCIDVLKLLLK